MVDKHGAEIIQNMGLGLLGVKGESAKNTALIAIAPEQDIKVIALLGEVNGLLEYARKRVIAADEDLAPATNDLTLMANLGKAIKEKQKEYADPIKEHLKGVNDAFNLLTIPLAAANQLTRDKILSYRQAQEAKRAEVERINRLRIEAAEAEAKLNGTGEISESVNLLPDAPLPVAHVYTQVGTLGTVKNRKYRIVNFAQLPDTYKLENSILLNKVTKAGIPEITGVEFYFEESLRITSRGA